MTDSNGEGDPKENADVPPVLPSEQPSKGEGGVLSPEDLDISESPYVAEVSDGRYVVSADHSAPTVPDDADATTQSESRQSHESGASAESSEATASNAASENEGRPEADDESADDETAATDDDAEADAASAATAPATPRSADTDAPSVPPSPELARSVLADELERSNARLAVDIVSQFGDDTIRHRTASDDVVRTFDNLVLWYAQNVARSTPTTRTASLLFAKSEFTPTLASSRVREAAAKHGLDESSTIEELLEALD
ncbi:flagella cluster protein [Natronorubrum sp. JWXQ-INN-674]|uniref:Flagella cluster protein n=1 Tax=Natronorubrum halalkaliphilum TaxID=2691917 RepID=A0A6B0VIX2_9EURY|nr:flagella cluster protein [Natronorubrum halalkaliphilum]MXV61801.1 flagella cluster protein [Natronorubrum halalkaliphilum]